MEPAKKEEDLLVGSDDETAPKDLSQVMSQARNKANDMLIVRDVKELQALFKTENLLKGYNVEDKEEEEEVKDHESMFKVPADLFKGFEELTEDNDMEFEYLASEIVIGWLE